MRSAELLVDAFDRIGELVHGVLEGLSAADLAVRPGAQANSIGWLVWHLTRIQDDHVADAAGTGQVWDAEWVERMALPFDVADTGYGHTSGDVATVRVPSAGLLADYHDAVLERTRAFVSALADADLDRVVDRRWDPPVTLGVRLVSVIGDDLQHAGQAAYVRGLLHS